MTDQCDKLFVSGLSQHTTVESLVKAVGRFGVIQYCRIVRSMQSKGGNYGFVAFVHPDSANRLLCSKSIHVDGRRCRIQLARSTMRSTFAESSLEELRRKVYIGGFRKDLTEAEISMLFGVHGAIEKVILNRDIKTGLSRGSGFVWFQKEGTASRVARLNIKELNGYRIIALACNNKTQLSSSTSACESKSVDLAETHNPLKCKLIASCPKLIAENHHAENMRFNQPSTYQANPSTW